MAQVLILPAAIDCDPSEVALTWSLLAAAGHDVILATPTGDPPKADPRMLTGAGLGPLAPVLAARTDARDAWQQLENSDAYHNTKAVVAVDVDACAAVVFPGGHAKGMRAYLESVEVQAVARAAFAQNKVVGAICHGVVVLARAGVLKGRRTTSLTRTQEMLAWQLTRLWLGDYYRTYPQTVEDEVRAALASDADYDEGPLAVLRDDAGHEDRGFVVEDGNYVSARWPGDCYRFAHALLTRLA